MFHRNPNKLYKDLRVKARNASLMTALVFSPANEAEHSSDIDLREQVCPRQESREESI